MRNKVDSIYTLLSKQDDRIKQLENKFNLIDTKIEKIVNLYDK